MKPWMVLGGVVLALFLLSRVRVGGFAEYSGEGLLAKLRVGPFFYTLYPVKPKAKKEKKEKKKEKKKKGKPKPEGAPSAKPGGTVELLRRYLPMVPVALRGVRRKIRVDLLRLDYTAAAADAAEAAMAYGRANAAIGMILPVLENNLKVKERRVRTAVDFGASAPTVYIHAALSMTIGQGVTLSVRLLLLFLKLTLRGRAKRNAEKEAV